MIRRMLAGVMLVESMSRSNVTSIALTVSLRTRLSAVTGAPGTCDRKTCGPVTTSGSESWSYGPGTNVVDVLGFQELIGFFGFGAA